MYMPCRDGPGAMPIISPQKPSSPGVKSGRYLGRYQRKLHSFSDSSSPVRGGGSL